MYSKFVLPNWNLLGHMLKQVPKVSIILSSDKYVGLMALSIPSKLNQVLYGPWKENDWDLNLSLWQKSTQLSIHLAVMYI